MTATEVLRRLLEERGVEWSKGAYPNEARTYWHDTVARPWNEQRVYVHAILTPEQAVAATLGSGTCHNVSTTGNFRCSECDAADLDFDKPSFCHGCGARVVS